MRFIIQEDRAIWVREFYAVEVDDAADNPETDAEETYYQGDYEYLGFNLMDSVSHLDAEIHKIEQSDNMPWMAHPASERMSDFAKLVKAAEDLLVDAIDRGECFDDHECADDNTTADEEGRLWFNDWYGLYEALKPFRTARKEVQS